MKGLTYKSFDMKPHLGGGVAVHDPRFPAEPVHVANGYTAARRWISAYRKGAQWAVETALVKG